VTSHRIEAIETTIADNFYNRLSTGVPRQRGAAVRDSGGFKGAGVVGAAARHPTVLNIFINKSPFSRVQKTYSSLCAFAINDDGAIRYTLSFSPFSKISELAPVRGLQVSNPPRPHSQLHLQIFFRIVLVSSCGPKFCSVSNYRGNNSTIISEHCFPIFRICFAAMFARSPLLFAQNGSKHESKKRESTTYSNSNHTCSSKYCNIKFIRFLTHPLPCICGSIDFAKDSMRAADIRCVGSFGTLIWRLINHTSALPFTYLILVYVRWNRIH